MRGSSLLRARAHQPGGTGSPAEVVVGAQEGPVGGCNFQRPGHTNPGGRGDVPRWWSVLKEGLWGVAALKARAHQPRGAESPAQVVVCAQGAAAGAAVSIGPGTPA